MALPMPCRELEERLKEAGNTLLARPLCAVDKLLPLLDRTEKLLSRVEQSPSRSMQAALSVLKEALIKEELLRHSDADVKVGVASCISDITRITAPDAPYGDEDMKDVFQLIVSSFENISDTSSRSHGKRATILETVAKVRSCVIMLDLECDQLIVDMFQLFLKSIRDDHDEDIFESMETIMTLVLEESEDISVDLLRPILDTLERNNEAVPPIAKKLAETVVRKSVGKIGPYLRQAVRLLGTSVDDYSGVLASVISENNGATEHNNENVSRDQSVIETYTHSASPVQAPVTQVQNDDVGETDARNRSSNSNVSNDVNTMGTEVAMTDSNDSKKADSSSPVDAKSTSKSESDGLDEEKPAVLEAKVEHAVDERDRQLNAKHDSAGSSDIGDDEKQAEQVPCDQEILEDDVHNSSHEVTPEEVPSNQEIPSGDVRSSPSEVPLAEANKSPDKIENTSIQVSPSEAPKNEDVNIASLNQHCSLPKQNWSRKSARGNRKKNLVKEGTVSVSKEACEGDNSFEAKKQQSLGKKQLDKKNNKDKVLTGDEASKNHVENTSDSETRLPDDTKKVDDASEKMKDGSTSTKEGRKKSGGVKARSKKVTRKSSAREDPVKDVVTSPMSPRSMEDESDGKETPNTGDKRKQTPSTDKHPQTEAHNESLVGRKVKVWWPDDKTFYKGEIKSYIPARKTHKVVYTDGDVEVLNLSKERWEFIEDDTVSDGGGVLESSSRDISTDVQTKKKGTSSEASSKRAKLENSTKSVTKSGGKSEDDAAAKKSKSNKSTSGGKNQDNSAKASGKSEDVNEFKTTRSSKSAANSKGKTPAGVKPAGGSVTGTIKSNSSKVKGTDQSKEKSPESAKLSEMAKGKSSAAAKSGSKSGKKRRR